MSNAEIAVGVGLFVLAIILSVYFFVYYEESPDDQTSDSVAPTESTPAALPVTPAGPLVDPAALPVTPAGPSYDFYAGKDSPGNDFDYAGNVSLAEIEAACNSKPACVGYNSNGWLKESILPQEQWVEPAQPYGGLYVRK